MYGTCYEPGSSCAAVLSGGVVFIMCVGPVLFTDSPICT